MSLDLLDPAVISIAAAVYALIAVVGVVLAVGTVATTLVSNRALRLQRGQSMREYYALRPLSH